MNYNTPHTLPERIREMIAISCMILFSLFSFFFLYIMGGDLLSVTQYALSGGITHYSQFFGALLITIVLQLLQVLTLRFTCLSGRFYALTYFPSFLFLTIISCSNKTIFEHFTFGSWSWLLPSLLFLFVIVVLLIHRFSRYKHDDDSGHASHYLWPNYLTLLLMMLLTGAIQHTPDTDLYEMKAEQAILRGDYEEAASTGINSLAVTPRLNRLRLFALAQIDELGEHLLDYPQPFGSYSLIDISDTLQYEEFNSHNICDSLGLRVLTGSLTPDSYFSRLLPTDTLHTKKIVGDYCLCNQLLNKNLTRFLEILPIYYPPDSVSLMQLPSLYRQALLIETLYMGETNPDSLEHFTDTLTLQTFKAYRALKDECTDDTERYNRTRREYSNTLFWYWDYYSAFKE